MSSEQLVAATGDEVSLFLDGDTFDGKKRSFKKLLSEERKARLSREKVEQDETLALQHTAMQEIKQAGDSMISAVKSEGTGFPNSLKPNLSWAAFSSLLHFKWAPPIIEFAKAHVESMLSLKFVSFQFS